MKFSVNGGNKDIKITLNERNMSEGISCLDVKANFACEQIPEQFNIEFKIPMTDIYSIWSPCVRYDRHLGPNWSKRATPSRLASWMPLHSLVSADGKNKLAIAVSDALDPISIATGVCEEDACIECKISFFTNKVAPISEYSAVVRIDTRSIAYYDSIYDVVEWWEKDCGYIPTHVPEHAKLPMNSLWYSYHQAIDVEDIIKECKLSKPLGMDTVIVDDGWQTDDNSRGYAYCGDWRVAKAKIPDIKDFVNRIHETGMKVMFWYSVPFIGIHTENYEHFKDMLLDRTGNSRDFWSLDPRYKEVRDFLVKTYADSVSNWGLDGLKLDFIDSFSLSGKSLEYDARRDYQSLEDAIDALMTEVTETLKSINNDVLIEFRQSYVGPAIRKYGNMLRVGDCPNDAILNRQDVVNLRLTSGKTAVHSDMLMWNIEDSVESAALQFASVLYSVPQVSMKISNLPEEHKKMLAFYLAFWREHRETLLEGKLLAANPESAYSLVCAEKDRQAIFTSYTDTLIDCRKYNEIIAVNAARSSALIIKGAASKTYKVVNCKGEEISSGVISSVLEEIKVPLAGMVFVQ